MESILRDVRLFEPVLPKRGGTRVHHVFRRIVDKGRSVYAVEVVVGGMVGPMEGRDTWR
jgi:hypothetical protein